MAARNRSRTNYVKTLVELAEALVEWENAPPTTVMHQPEHASSQMPRRVKGAGGQFALPAESVRSHHWLVEELLDRHGLSEKFSPDYVGEKIDNILIDIVDSLTQERASTLLDELLASHDEYSKEHTVWVPVSGFEPPEEPVSLGAIIIKQVDQEDLERIRSGADALFDRHGFGSEHPAIQPISFLESQVAAVHTSVAEPHRARQRALDETRIVLDVIRYAIPWMYPRGTCVGLLHEVSSGVRVVPVLEEDGPLAILEVETVGPLENIDLSASSLNEMQELGVFKILDVLARAPKISAFEEAIARSVRWFGRMVESEREEERLLSGIIALETLCSKKGRGGSIQNQVAEGAALIAADRLEDRKYIKKRVKNFYSKRSAVSHGGETTIKPWDTSELMLVLHRIIMFSLDYRDKFREVGDLLDWLDDAKLQAALETEKK